jgi:hypothetical protein
LFRLRKLEGGDWVLGHEGYVLTAGPAVKGLEITRYATCCFRWFLLQNPHEG